jgi:periplasmic protein TonB
MNKFLQFSVLFLFQFVSAQQPRAEMTQSSNSGGIEALYSIHGVEVKPEFPGGVQKFYKFVQKNLKLPDTDNLDTISISFIVERNGSISNVIVKDKESSYLQKSFDDLMSKSPKWTPAYLDGETVRCSLTIPIYFKIN